MSSYRVDLFTTSDDKWAFASREYEAEAPNKGQVIRVSDDDRYRDVVATVTEVAPYSGEAVVTLVRAVSDHDDADAFHATNAASWVRHRSVKPALDS